MHQPQSGEIIGGESLIASLEMFQRLGLDRLSDWQALHELLAWDLAREVGGKSGKTQELARAFTEQIVTLFDSLPPMQASAGRAALEVLKRVSDGRDYYADKLPDPAEITEILAGIATMAPDQAAALAAALGAGNRRLAVLGVVYHYRAALSDPALASQAIDAIAARGSTRNASAVPAR
jgi:hypothetical protein